MYRYDEQHAALLKKQCIPGQHTKQFLRHDMQASMFISKGALLLSEGFAILTNLNWRLYTDQACEDTNVRFFLFLLNLF